MNTDQVDGLLSGFLTAEARSAVVRLRIPDYDSSGLFSGFFVSPDGHLVTAFHAVKAVAFDLPNQFDVLLEFDAETGSAPRSLTTSARCEPGWADPTADWVVLRTDFRPGTYLPVAQPHALERSGDPLCAALRIYGFTVTEQGAPHLGALTGQYLRPAPERRRFHVAFSVRSRGQSGGPAIDLRSHSVVGSVVGYRQDEQLTADLAAIDQDTLATVGPDFAELARRWRLRAVQHLCEQHAELGPLTTSDQFTPGFPDVHLENRGLIRDVLRPIEHGRTSVSFLHGPPGSGKTVLALEAAHVLLDAGRAHALFWHDFEPPQHRSTDNLIRRLAVHLLHHDEAVEPLQACLTDGFVRDQSPAVNATIAALRRARHVLVFDNLHFAELSSRPELSALLSKVFAAVDAGDCVVITTSWYRPPPDLRAATHRIEGLDRDEVERLLGLHGVTISTTAMDLLCRLATDITCVEAFLRSPAWRAEVTSGVQPSEPTELHRYWLNRFLGQVPDAGRRVLLALAVLDQPSTRDLVEETAAVSGFASTLDRLLTSPPLAHDDGDLFHAHYNVKRAVLTISDRDDVMAMHRRAGDACLRRGDRLGAARQLVRAGDPGGALDLVFHGRDDIIAAGRVQDLQSLAATLRDNLSDRPGFASRLHAILASCSNIRGEYHAATRHWGFALRRSTNPAETAALHNRKGDSHRLSSDYPAARQDYEAAARQAGTDDSDQALRELGRARLGLAKLDRLGCDYPSARLNYDEAHDAFEIIFDEPGLMEADFGRGEVSRLMADWEAATESYQASLARARKQANLEREAYALWGIGEVQRLSGDPDEARHTHRQGLQLCRQVGDTRSQGWALLGLAESDRMAAGTGFMELYDEARRTFATTGSATEIAHTVLGKAEADRGAGRTDLDDYRSALDTYRAKNLRHCIVQCQRCYAAALRTMGRHDEAADQLAAAAELATSCSLTHELRRIEAMRRGGGDDSPFLPLNFP